MSSKQKRTIARQNGAKAAGSKTPQGIQTSARNALRHGLTSQTLVLFNESPDKFAELLQTYIEKFQPQDSVEIAGMNAHHFAIGKQLRHGVQSHTIHRIVEGWSQQ